MNFYKDGKDIKQAFCQPELKEGPLFPFVQIQDVCSLSVFHPSVYPKYDEPQPELDRTTKKKALVEPEPQPRRSSQKRPSLKQQAKKSARESHKHQRKSLTKKQAKILQKKGKAPKEDQSSSHHSSIISNAKPMNPNTSVTSSQYTNPNHHRQSSSLDGKNLMWNQLSNFDEQQLGMGTIGGMSHIEPQRQYDSFLYKIQEEKKQLQQKDSVLQ